MNDETIRGLLDGAARSMGPTDGSPDRLRSVLRRQARRRKAAGYAAGALAIVATIVIAAVAIEGPSSRSLGVRTEPLGSSPISPGAPTTTPPASLEFRSPSGNIHCELDGPSYPSGAVVYCQTMAPAQSVTMKPTGVVATCDGNLCLGNPSVTEYVLAYGNVTVLGPFSCASTINGMTCTIPSGTGFTINRSGVTRLGSTRSAKSPVT